MPKFTAQWRILLNALSAAPGAWYTLQQLHGLTGIRETSVSAQLRNLRKKAFGGYMIEKRRLNGGEWEYRRG